MASITRSPAIVQTLRNASRMQISSFSSSIPRTSSRLLFRPTSLAPSPFRTTRVAAFHASTRKAILPPLPQAIDGTVNDPAPIPKTSPTHGSYHWSFERALSVGLIPLTVAPFIGGSLNPILDSVLCATLLLHSHIGFEACITDYFPGYRVPGVKRALEWVLRFATVLAGVGLYSFETNDIGLTAAIAKIWTA